MRRTAFSGTTSSLARWTNCQSREAREGAHSQEVFGRHSGIGDVVDLAFVRLRQKSSPKVITNGIAEPVLCTFDWQLGAIEADVEMLVAGDSLFDVNLCL
jgi:pantoate kinase